MTRSSATEMLEEFHGAVVQWSRTPCSAGIEAPSLARAGENPSREWNPPGERRFESGQRFPRLRRYADANRAREELPPRKGCP
jgi:hypothetical protein